MVFQWLLNIYNRMISGDKMLNILSIIISILALISSAIIGKKQVELSLEIVFYDWQNQT